MAFGFSVNRRRPQSRARVFLRNDVVRDVKLKRRHPLAFQPTVIVYSLKVIYAF